jgi:hypothetical protein
LSSEATTPRSGKQDKVQDENGIYLLPQPIADKGDIAAYRGRTQTQHRAHTKCEKDERRRKVTHAIDQRHYGTNLGKSFGKKWLKSKLPQDAHIVGRK